MGERGDFDYANRSVRDDWIYGTIGGVIVMLLWFYLSGLVLLVGAEFNSEIEHASPYGKAEGEKVPGEHRGWLFRARWHSGIGEATDRAAGKSQG